MSEANQIDPMQIWAILNPERYIKKSINDGSLAIYDEKKSADRQFQPVSEANNEECFIEECALCKKVKLDEYINVHNEMYEMLTALREDFGFNHPVGIEIDELLAKARGEK